jgi:hypothetical protein
MARDRAEAAMWTELSAHGALDDLGPLESDVAGELSICFNLAQGTKPCPYGVLITSGPPVARIGWLLTSNLDVDELRRAAEGRTLLVCRWGRASIHLLRLRAPLQTDTDCEALVAATAAVLLRTDAGGRIWLVGPRTTSYVDGPETWTRPHMSGVVDALTGVAPAADRRTLESLAHVAYSHVRPTHAGATLVYQWTRADADGARFSGASVEALRLNVNEPEHLSGILHQVQQRDGAVVFSRSGVLCRAGAILVPSSASVESVGAVRGGTRHHSAAWHSFDRPDVLCFVISRAGRVTVFSRGEDVSPARLPARVAPRSEGSDAFRIR